MAVCVESVLVDLSRWIPVVRFGGLQEMTNFLCEWCSFLSVKVCSNSNVYNKRGLHRFSKENDRMC
jgi:hypothetical protein